MEKIRIVIGSATSLQSPFRVPPDGLPMVELVEMAATIQKARLNLIVATSNLAHAALVVQRAVSDPQIGQSLTSYSHYVMLSPKASD